MAAPLLTEPQLAPGASSSTLEYTDQLHFHWTKRDDLIAAYLDAIEFGGGDISSTSNHAPLVRLADIVDCQDGRLGELETKYGKDALFSVFGRAESECGLWKGTLASHFAVGVVPDAERAPPMLLILSYRPSLPTTDTKVTFVEAEASGSLHHRGKVMPLYLLDEAVGSGGWREVPARWGYEEEHEFKEADPKEVSCTSSNNAVLALDILAFLSGTGRDHPFRFSFTLQTRITTRRRFPLSRLLEPPIQDSLFQYLDLRSVLRLAQAEPALRDSLEQVPTRRTRQLLERWFVDVKAFCMALRTARAVVGGSGVLSVLDPGGWTPGDLDVVVPSRRFEMFVKVLKKEGYEQVDEIEEDEYETNPAIGVHHYPYRKTWKDGRVTKIDVISLLSIRITPVMYILSYHSTPVMNYFDGLDVVCLFPHLTFSRCSWLLDAPDADNDSDRLIAGLAKYQARGYRRVKGWDLISHVGLLSGECVKVGQLKSRTWRARIGLLE
ncbi:hypothetical protein MNV49_002161 [Pseudohyphozyma bogoriensis]|nr:hypothetical protein MNV49_002161 [Pseudohyphozyma bogoriensis]